MDDGADGYTYDTTARTITVKVEQDARTKQLKVTATYPEGGAKFVNPYKAEGKIDLEAKKVLTGIELEEGKFTFELKDAAGNVIQRKSNAADGTVKFDTITYTQDDVAKSPIVYTVNEVNAGEAGYTYDGKTVTVNVTLTDNGDGTIDAVADAGVTALTFNNTYASTGKVKLGAKKVLTGRTLAEGEFTFQLKDAEGNVLQSKTNAADGTVTFDEITYTQADMKDADGALVKEKSVEYTISEVNSGKAGYSYDDAEQKVTVTLTENGNGTITATADKTAAEVTFNNTYGAEGTAVLEATKKLSGKALEAGEFTFQLLAADGSVIDTKTNDADGTITFTALTYDQDDLADSPYT